MGNTTGLMVRKEITTMLRSLTLTCAVTILSWQAFTKTTANPPRMEKHEAAVISSALAVDVTLNAAPPDLMANSCPIPSCQPKYQTGDRNHPPADHAPSPGGWFERISVLVRLLIG